jgi:hypothetical protein
MAGDLSRVFGSRFVALVASSATTAVGFAAPIHASDLESLSALTRDWHADGLETPLLLTPDEFHRSLDTFPLEYQAIVDRHVPVAGTPPFAAVHLDPATLRHACEVQAKSHLIHLRQGWLESAGEDGAVAEMLVASAAPLRALLSNVARLHGGAPGDEHAAQAGARIAGLPDALISDVLRLESAPALARHLVRQMPAYLDASERLWAFVDRWQV